MDNLEKYLHHQKIIRMIEDTRIKNPITSVISGIFKKLGNISISELCEEKEGRKRKREEGRKRKREDKESRNGGDDFDSLIETLEESYEPFIRDISGKSIDEVISDFEMKLANEEYCFQGGYGHSVTYKTNYNASHWCVRPEYFEVVYPDPLTRIALAIMNIKWNINEEADYERWGN